jgi:hypothetical protein
LHLADCAVQRGVGRILFQGRPPLDRLQLADLWEHVAREQGLNAELLGRGPEEFYAQVRRLLKAEDVLGQDHAVDRI